MKRREKKLDGNYTKMLRVVFNQILEAAQYKNNSCTATYHPSQKPFKENEQEMLCIVDGVRTNWSATFGNGLLHMDK